MPGLSPSPRPHRSRGDPQRALHRLGDDERRIMLRNRLQPTCASAGAGERRCDTGRSRAAAATPTDSAREEGACMMIPTHDEAAAGAAPVRFKREVEGGAAEAAETVGRARRGGDLPAGRGRARDRQRPMAQQKPEPAAVARGERQPPRRGEVGGFAGRRQLGDDDGDAAGAQRLLQAQSASTGRGTRSTISRSIGRPRQSSPGP